MAGVLVLLLNDIFVSPESHSTKTFIGEQCKCHNVLALLRLIAV